MSPDMLTAVAFVAVLVIVLAVVVAMRRRRTRVLASKFGPEYAHTVDAVGKRSKAEKELEERTSDFMYVRLHGHTELYASGYSARSLDGWAAKVRGWRDDGLDVYVYFDNDSRGRAPYDAVGLLRRLDWSRLG